jgi:glycosyltransferase involved in cell wall biosynthesis
VPTIAVVIPAYNAAAWIAETLESVLAQTRPADEIIVVDDGSTDATADCARAFADRGVVLLQQANGGPPAAYNAGFHAARSDYVAMLSADDLSVPRRIEWQAEAIDLHPEADVLFGRLRTFGDSEELHPHPSTPGIQDRPRFLRELYTADVIPAPTAMVRRALHTELGSFDESLPSEDYEFWLRALRAGATFFYDERELVRQRMHGDNVSQRALIIWEMNHRLRCEYAPDVGDSRLSDRLIARDLREIARCRFGAQRLDGARDAYRASLRRRPGAEALIGAAVLSVPPLARALSAASRRRGR